MPPLGNGSCYPCAGGGFSAYADTRDRVGAARSLRGCAHMRLHPLCGVGWVYRVCRYAELGGSCALPHPRSLFLEKSDQKTRHAPFGQIPFNCHFSGRRAQSTAHRRILASFLFVVQCHVCPSSRPEKQHRDLPSSATVAGAGSGLGVLVFVLPPGRVAGKGGLGLVQLL